MTEKRKPFLHFFMASLLVVSECFIKGENKLRKTGKKRSKRSKWYGTLASLTPPFIFLPFPSL